jgi:hypothetical protein
MLAAISAFFLSFIPFFNAFRATGEALEEGATTLRDMASINRKQYILSSAKVTADLEAALAALEPVTPEPTETPKD